MGCDQTAAPAAERKRRPRRRQSNVRLAARHYPGRVTEWRLLDGHQHTGSMAKTYGRGLRFAFIPPAPSPLKVEPGLRPGFWILLN